MNNRKAMSADLIQLIAIFSSLLTIVASLITIYLFLAERSKKRIVIKSTMVAITIILILITICILSPERKEKVFTSIPPVSDSLKIRIKPSINMYFEKNKPNKGIEKLIDEARNTQSISQALSKFEQAYKLLPEKQRNKISIDSIKSYTDFKTQVNHYNEFFKSLNY